MGSIYTQITRESGRTPSTLASLTRKIENGVNAINAANAVNAIFNNVFHSLHKLIPSPKSVGGWGSAPDPPPPIARESAFALASLTR